jgi:hypothetical protein
MSEFTEEYQRLVEVLVDRGFAKAVSRDSNGKIDALDLTRDGEVLLKHLMRLFDIPKVKPTSLSDKQISNLVMVLLLKHPRLKG